MRYRIIIDTGTTNTRVYVIDGNNNMVFFGKKDAGVRDTAITGSNKKIKDAVKACLDSAFAEKRIKKEDIEWITASGMITSELGLYEVKHITAPAGVRELAEGIEAKVINDIIELPIYFIPGVKNNTDDAPKDLISDYSDVMRGEEVECIASIGNLEKGRERLVILPGSHMKIIFVDKDKRIKHCITTISGELLDSITNHTILSQATDKKFVSEESFDILAIEKGFDCAKEWGLTKACFSARVMTNFLGYSKTFISNFLLGAVIESDIKAVKNYIRKESIGKISVVAPGEGVMLKAISAMIEREGLCSEIIYDKEKRKLPLSVEGALRVMEERK